MTLPLILDNACRYFGGDYDAGARAYLTPQIAGLGAVRRARGKVSSKDEHHLAAGMGTTVHGSVMLVHLQAGEEKRIALAGASAGIKQQSIQLNLHVFLHSSAEYAEDAQDAFVALLEGLLTHIRADRTLGTGGFEAGPGGFQVGEGTGSITWEMDPVETSARITRGYLIVALDATAYLIA